MVHWCGQEGRRCEAIGPLLLPFPLFSLSLFLSQQKRPLGLNKQITWPSNTTHHRCTGTPFRQRLLVSAVCLFPLPKDARKRTQTHTHTHTAELPHQHDSGFTSPHIVRSPIPQVALEQHQQYKHREKGGERRTIQLLNGSAAQEELSIKLIKTGRESRN